MGIIFHAANKLISGVAAERGPPSPQQVVRACRVEVIFHTANKLISGVEAERGPPSPQQVVRGCNVKSSSTLQAV